MTKFLVGRQKGGGQRRQKQMCQNKGRTGIPRTVRTTLLELEVLLQQWPLSICDDDKDWVEDDVPT